MGNLKTWMVYGLMLLPSLGKAQSGLIGNWQGQLKVGMTSLNLVFHVSGDKSVTMDSPDQGAYGIPTAVNYLSADSVNIKMDVLKAVYAGKLKDDGKLNGVFTQGGFPFALELTKGELTNKVIQTIMARRSVRKYLDKPVEHEKLAVIAKCGIHAPSAMNQQTWAVRVVENSDFIKGTTEIFKKENPEQVKRDANFKNMYRNAPNIIVVACPKDDHYATLNVGLMGENMMLAAQSLGLGTCCLGSAAMFLQRSEAYKPYIDQLHLPAGYEISYILAVGYPDEAPAAKPRDEGKIEFIK